MTEIQIVIINSLGEFRARKLQVTDNELSEITKVAQKFYTAGGFELNLEDGSFIVFSPGIIQNSILKINKKTIEEDV
jgi:hypothetical protein